MTSIGGAAHLWDCIPSKSMIATGGAMSLTRAIGGMGLATVDTAVDVDTLTRRIESDQEHHARQHDRSCSRARVSASFAAPVDSPGRTPPRSSARGGTETIEFDAALVSTGSRPRIPDVVSAPTATGS